METNGLFKSFLVLDVGVQLQFYFLKTCTNLPGFLGSKERFFGGGGGFLCFVFCGFFVVCLFCLFLGVF